MSDPATDSAARIDPQEGNRSRRRQRLRGLTVTAAAAAVLFGGAAVAAADTGGDESGGSSTPSSSAPSSSAPSSSAPSGADQSRSQDAAPPAPGDGGPAARAHSPHLDGDVTSVSSGSILITDHEGFTRTINLSAGHHLRRRHQRAH